MKKLFFSPFLLAIFIIGCDEVSTSLEEQNLTTNIDNLNRGPKPKVDICHYDADNDSWHLINVSENALPAHLNHGDVQLIDNDGDGWVEALNECVPGGDCDDNDDTIYPGAEEICGDGIDNNCDGQVDEGCFPEGCGIDWVVNYTSSDVSSYYFSETNNQVNFYDGSAVVFTSTGTCGRYPYFVGGCSPSVGSTCTCGSSDENGNPVECAIDEAQYYSIKSYFENFVAGSLAPSTTRAVNPFGVLKE